MIDEIKKSHILFLIWIHKWIIVLQFHFKMHFNSKFLSLSLFFFPFFEIQNFKFFFFLIFFQRKKIIIFLHKNEILFFFILLEISLSLDFTHKKRLLQNKKISWLLPFKYSLSVNKSFSLPIFYHFERIKILNSFF